MISPQLKFDIKSEIIIDNFAGSECASTDILWLWRTTMTKTARRAFSGCLSGSPTLTGTKSWLLRLCITYPKPHVARHILR
jgi:hypothetical protein